MDAGRDPGLRRWIVEEQQAIDARIRDLLGDDGFSRFHAYRQMLPLRAVVHELDRSFESAGVLRRGEQYRRIKEQIVGVFEPQ